MTTSATSRTGAQPPLVFLHIGRTGGTSLIHYLDRQFPADEICPAHDGVEFGELERQNKLSGYSLYRGHVNPQLRGLIGPDSRVITFVRRPIPRLFSVWRHLRLHPIPFKGKSGTRAAFAQTVAAAAHHFDFEEFCYAVMRSGEPWFFNAMTASFGFVDIETSERPDVLANAKRMLDSFAFVGFTEAFDQSVTQLQRLFGWEVEPIARLNAAPELPLPQNGKFLRWLKFAVRLDEELYDHAMQTRQAQLMPARS